MNKTIKYLSDIENDEIAYKEAVSASISNPCMWTAKKRSISIKTIDILPCKDGLKEVMKETRDGRIDWRRVLATSKILERLFVEYESLFDESPSASISWMSIIPMLRHGYSPSRIEAVLRSVLTTRMPFFLTSGMYYYGLALCDTYELSHRERVALRILRIGPRKFKRSDLKKLSRLSPQSLRLLRETTSIWYLKKDDCSYEIDWQAVCKLANLKLNGIPSQYNVGEISKVVLWEQLFGYVPKSPTIRNALGYDELVKLSQNRNAKKAFYRILKDIVSIKDTLSEHDVKALAVGVLKLPEQRVRALIREVDLNLLHDLYDLTEEGVELMWLYRKRWSKALAVARNISIDEIKSIFIDKGIKNKLDVAYARLMRMRSVTSEEGLSEVLIPYGYTDEAIKEVTDRWMSRNVTYETIQSIDVSISEYTMYRLHRDDARQLIAGDLTNCCQHIYGMGESCVWHSAENPNGATFFVEKNGKVIAQSWAWRNGDTVVFDNIETLSDAYRDDLAAIYKAAAMKLVGNLGINKVLVGSGHDDVGVHAYFKECEIVKPPEGVYSDALRQYVIYEIGRYDHLINRLKAIEKMAYPEEYQQLQEIATTRDIAEYVGCDDDELRVIVSNDWYAIIALTHNSVYIADLASERKKLNRIQFFEFITKLKEIMGNRKILKFEARESSSYRLVKRAVEQGVLDVVMDEPRIWGAEVFHDMVCEIKADLM